MVNRPRAWSIGHTGRVSACSLQVDRFCCVGGRLAKGPVDRANCENSFSGGSFHHLLDDFKWNFGYPFWTHLATCEDGLSRHPSRLFRIASGTNLIHS